MAKKKKKKRARERPRSTQTAFRLRPEDVEFLDATKERLGLSTRAEALRVILHQYRQYEMKG